MRIGNVKPSRGLLTAISVNKDDRCFTDVLDVDWPEPFKVMVEKHNLVDVPFENGTIGGRMTRHVIQHSDAADGNRTLLWFPKINKPLDFVVGDYQYKVNSGDVFLFDHTVPHSVSAVDKTTGVWYFLAKWWDVRGGVK